ncbi:MAG: type II secretion system F family protein [Pseudomonadota bacterium]|nr:type II secretion system F family protein [Pseudomonadota bacterium]
MDPALIQTGLTATAALLIGGSAVGAGWFAFVQGRRGSQLKARLAPEAEPAAAKAKKTGAGFAPVVGWVRRLGDAQAVRDPNQVSSLRFKLVQAGFPNREAVPIFLGAKLAAMAGAALILMAVVPFAMRQAGGQGAAAAAGLLSLVAIMGPERFLSARKTKLQTEYRDGFPDMLDLLVASVEAGLSLDAAVNRVAAELDRRYPNLAEHMVLLTRELRAGRSRKEAWMALADRLGIDEARGLATMLRQAEEMGTSLGETLAVYADDMRSKRMLRAEEKALALPAKLTLPLILFIFPCLIGVLMLPAGLRLSEALSAQ